MVRSKNLYNDSDMCSPSLTKIIRLIRGFCLGQVGTLPMPEMELPDNSTPPVAPVEKTVDKAR